MAFQVLPIDTLWLDEVTEGLKQAILGLQHYELFHRNVDPSLTSQMHEQDLNYKEKEDMLYRTCYTIGIISA